MKVEHHVKIGQIKTGSTGDVLKTVLGSCVGIAFLMPELNRYALAHCLLPEAPKGNKNEGAKYVDQAIPNLIKALEISPDEYSTVQVVIAGGGHMLDVEKKFTKYIVGEANLQAAQNILKKLKIKILLIEPGLECGTRMSVDCTTGEFEIEKIKRVR